MNGTEYSDGVPLHGPLNGGQVSGLIGLYYPETDDKGRAVRYDNIQINDQ